MVLLQNAAARSVLRGGLAWRYAKRLLIVVLMLSDHTCKLESSFFTLTGINWETLTPINSQEVKFLALLGESNLNQFISGPTHKGHNTLDLILSNMHQLPVSIGTKLYSDHYRIFFSCNFDLIDATIKSSFSRSSFNAQAFNFYLSDLFKLLSFTDIKTGLS